MDYRFKNFDNNDYEKVRNFLIELSGEERLHINWNWARWEWMYFHPELDKSLLEKIGLWFSGEELAGFATYDMWPGECFFAVKRGFEELESSILEYAVNNFCNENGLGIAANDTDVKTINLLKSHGFVRNEQTENVLELDLNEAVFTSNLAEGITMENIHPQKDVFKHQKVLWKGFDHEGEVPLDKETVEKQRILLTAPHLNPLLHVVAKDQQSEYVSYCGLWYDKATDYVYVEPVCTIPEYRNQGVGRATVLEALKRAKDLGAKRAYVISYTDFYDKLGFKPHSHYTFYWYQN